MSIESFLTLVLAFCLVYSYGYVLVTLTKAIESVKNMSKITVTVYLIMFLLSPIFCPIFAGMKEAGK